MSAWCREWARPAAGSAVGGSPAGSVRDFSRPSVTTPRLPELAAVEIDGTYRWVVRMSALRFGRVGVGDGGILSTGCGSDDVTGGRWSAAPEGAPWLAARVAGRLWKSRAAVRDGSRDGGLRRGGVSGRADRPAVSVGLAKRRRRESVVCDLRHVVSLEKVSPRQSEGVRGNHLVSPGVGGVCLVPAGRFARPEFRSTVRAPARPAAGQLRTPEGDNTENTVRQNTFSADACRWFRKFRRARGLWKGSAVREEKSSGGCRRSVFRVRRTLVYSTPSRVGLTGDSPDPWSSRRALPAVSQSGGELDGHA
jgi:hypothetical protein